MFKAQSILYFFDERLLLIERIATFYEVLRPSIFKLCTF